MLAKTVTQQIHTIKLVLKKLKWIFYILQGDKQNNSVTWQQQSPQ